MDSSELTKWPFDVKLLPLIYPRLNIEGFISARAESSYIVRTFEKMRKM